jgi:drug/metabolite transporter (DMT)-like permease
VKSLSTNARGILAMAVAMLTFAGNDMFVKLARETLPPQYIMFYRGFVVIAFLLVLLRVTNQFSGLSRALEPRLLVRALLETAIAWSFISALGHMTIGDITALFMVVPLLITAGAALLLKEQVGWRRWSAVLVGFVGTLLIIKPTAESVNIWVFVALISVFGAAIRDLMTRGVDPAISSLVVSFTTSLFVFVASIGMSLATPGPFLVPSWTILGYLAAAGVLVAIGNYYVVVAFRGGDVSVISPFRYSVILWALLAGYLVWGDIPDMWGALGTVLIVLAGLYVIHRERVRTRDGAVKTVG